MAWLILDMGSSSVRARLVDDRARPIDGATASHTHTFATALDGQATADADDLRAALENCIDAVLAHPAASEIRAVGMATFVGNLVGLDADGAPVTPVYTYADTRSAFYAQSLVAEVDEAAVIQRTGCRLHSAYHPAKLRWLARTQPEAVSWVVQWSDIGTACYRRWFGRADVPCSYSVASWSGLFDRESCAWDADWLARLNLSPDYLPPLADFDTAQTGLSREYALRWPTLAYVPWLLPVGDGAAANLGSGAVGDGQTALTLGTTGALRTTVSRGATPVIPDGLWAYRIDRTRHVLGGATSEGGNVFAWARQTFVLPDPDSLEQALFSRRHDEHGLTALPLIAGERSPGWNASATATLHGLRASTTPLDIVQALMEGVAHRLAQIAEGIAGAGVVYAGGGALYTSPAWARMLCDALNRPLALLDEPEVTARGVALLLMGALDGVAAKTYPPRTRQILTPSSEGAARMAAARARQRALYARLYGG